MGTIAELPDSAYATLEAIAERVAVKETDHGHEGNGHVTGAPWTMTLSHMVPDAYVRKALDDECQSVALAREGQRNNTLNTAAYSVGQLVGAGGLDRSIAEDALTGAARRCGLPDSEAAATIRSGLDAGQGEPRDLSHLGADQHRRDPDRNETPTGTAAPSAGSRGGDSEEWALVTSRARNTVPNRWSSWTVECFRKS